MGTRWMSLSATGDTPKLRGYGIHGTWEPETIGNLFHAQHRLKTGFPPGIDTILFKQSAFFGRVFSPRRLFCAMLCPIFHGRRFQFRLHSLFA